MRFLSSEPAPRTAPDIPPTDAGEPAYARTPERRVLHIDFIHALEYLWTAAEDLHTTHNARAAFVQATARDLLEEQTPAPYLNYHIALALGWPIATGVIEGIRAP